MEFSGVLEERGWRADAVWKPRMYVLKGRVLHSYVAGQERSSYVIDAESFISVIHPGVDEKGIKSFADEAHKYVFSVCTKSFAPAYSKIKVVLAAPDKDSFNSWINILNECAFEGQKANIAQVWPTTFRNQTSLFNVSYNGRSVNDASTFAAVQLEEAPFSTSSSTKLGGKGNLKFPKNAWSYSNSSHSLSSNCLESFLIPQGSKLLSSDVSVLPPNTLHGLKLYYTLIMVAAEKVPGEDGHWSNEFSLLWMVANLRANAGLTSDVMNGQEVFPYIMPSLPYGSEKRKCYFLIFTQPDGLFCEVNIHRMKNNIAIMRTNFTNEEPPKVNTPFSNPKLWAQDMGFYNPAWVGSFYAECLANKMSGGSDASVHLNITYMNNYYKSISFDSRDSGESGDIPELTSFSFENLEILKPRKLLSAPIVMISFSNRIRSRNESYDYDSSDEREEVKVSKQKFSGDVRGSVCGESGKPNTIKNTSASTMTKSGNDRRRSQLVPNFQKCYTDDGQYDEVETLHRLDYRRKSVATMGDRPPFYPPYGTGIPAINGVNPMPKKNSGRTPVKALSADSVKSPKTVYEITPEKSQKLPETRSKSLPPFHLKLSFDESERDDGMEGDDGATMNVELTDPERKERNAVEKAEELRLKNKYNSSFFTLVFSSPDFPIEFEEESAEFVHWVVVNITGEDVRTGTVVAPYLGPCPPCNSGLHRHFFKLYLQEAKLEDSEIVSAQEVFLRRDMVNTAKWCAESSFTDPLAIRSYRTMWDTSCDDTHKQLGYTPSNEFLCPKDKKKLKDALDRAERARLTEVAVEAAMTREKERLRLEAIAAEEEKIRLDALEKERLRVEAIVADKERRAQEKEKLRLEAIAAENERLRLVAENERLKLEAIAAENERVRLEAIAAESERLRLKAIAVRLEAIAAENERLRLAAENERLKREAIAAANERRRLEAIAAENEKVRLEAIAAEKERVRLEAIAAENEKVRLKAIAAEKEKVRLEAIAAENEKVRLEAIAAENERLRLEAVRLEAIAAENERLRLEAIAAEKERVRLEAIAAENERRRLDAIAAENERLKLDAIAAEKERVRLEAIAAEKERVRLEAIAAENERLRLEAIAAEKERVRLEAIAAEKEKIRLEAIAAENEKVRLEAIAAEKEKVRLEAIAAEKEKVRLEAIAAENERLRLEAVRLEAIAAEKERVRLEAIAAENERLRLEAIAAENEKVRLEAIAAEKEKIRLEAVAAAREKIRLEAIAAENEKVRLEAIAAENERLRLEAIAAEKEKIRLEAVAAAKEKVRLEAIAAENERLRLEAIAAEKEKIRLEAVAAAREKIRLEAIAAENEKVRLEAFAAEKEKQRAAAVAAAQKARKQQQAAAALKAESDRQEAQAVESERLRVQAEAAEVRRQKAEVERMELERENARIARQKEEVVEAAAEARRLRLVADQIEAERLRKEREAAADVEVERQRLEAEELSQAKRLRAIEEAKALAERLRVEAEEEEERRRLQEIDDAKRRERFRLISDKWHTGPKDGGVERRSSGKEGETPAEAAERRQREYKERSDKAAKERLEKEAREKLERAEIIRREAIEAEIEQRRLRELEDRTGFVFEVIFPSNQALELTLLPFKVSYMLISERTGEEEETMMDCALVTASKNNNLTSNFLPGDLLVSINSNVLYSPQTSAESPLNFAENSTQKISEADEPRVAMVFRLLRKVPLLRNVPTSTGVTDISVYGDVTLPAEQNFSRSIPLSLQCAKINKILPLSPAETTIILAGVPNSCF